MSNLHRCFLPSFGSFAKAVSEEKIFRNQPIRNKNCLWRPFLLMDRDKMSNLYKGPSIDASYQVSVQFGWGVSEEKIKIWKVNGRWTTDAKWWKKLTLPLARWAKKDKQRSTKHYTESINIVQHYPHKKTRKVSGHVHMYNMWPKVLPHVKNPYIINQNHIFSNNYCEVISG